MLSKLDAIDDLGTFITKQSQENTSGIMVKIEDTIKMPSKLLRKHILSPEMTDKKNAARKLSYQRRDGNEVKINTVFEHADSLLKCTDGSMTYLISKRPLHAFQCIKKDGKWSQKHLGEKWAIFGTAKENYHFSYSSLSINNVMFE